MSKTSLSGYGRFVLLVAGLGGLLYGVDIGIFAPALLYLEKTVNLSIAQNSAIAAAVFLGSMLGSPLTGGLADRLGRRPVMVLSGALFSFSVGLIVLSQSFATLFVGRLLQGLAGGVIAVVVPLYLAEALPADRRGRATAIFQFMLTFGIVVASAIGFFYTRQAEQAIATAGVSASLVLAAANHAWRSMFLAILFPGLLFLFGSLALVESPRWLARHGRADKAAAALLRISDEASAQSELGTITASPAALPDSPARLVHDSLLQRRYVVPFLLACVVLACNQTTGINSILTFLVVILKQAGLDPTHASQGDLAVKLLNCIMTIVAVALVDRKGRTFLLKLGTSGIVISLLAACLLFLSFERGRVDERGLLQKHTRGNQVHLQPSDWRLDANGDAQFTVIYSYGDGDHVASASTLSKNPLDIEPAAAQTDAPLQIKHAYLGATPSPHDRLAYRRLHSALYR